MPYTNKILGLHWTVAFGLPLVVLILLLALVGSAFAAPPVPSAAPTPPAFSPKDILYTSTTTNAAGVVKEIRVIEREVVKYLPPTNTTIRLKFHDKLDTNVVYTVDFTTPRRSAFAGWEIIEK